MILDIDKVTLEVVRGDSFELPLVLNCGTREEFIPYTLQPCDFLYIGLTKPGQPFEHAEARVALNFRSETDSFNNPIFSLSSRDTALLEPGKYYMSIKFKTKDKVTTLVDNKIFFITGSKSCC